MRRPRRTLLEEALHRERSNGQAHDHRNGDGHAGRGASGRERHAGGRTADEAPPKPRFPAPRLSSELQAGDPEAAWLWRGLVARGAVTLLSALPKAGKTTLLSHLLRALGQGGECCGHEVTAGKILYVTEESESRWVERRDALGLGDWCRWQVRPFLLKPRFDEWLDLLTHLQAVLTADPADLVVFDTLASLWPVRDENDAGQVQSALQPLHGLTGATNCGLLLSHPLCKGDGAEATGARGSGALTAFPDVLLELRRYSRDDRADRRRVLTGYGRWDDTPSELVVELAADGTGYVGRGDRQEVSGADTRLTLLSVLPCEPPGIEYDEIVNAWPGEATPQRQRLLAELKAGVNRGDWRREGAGKRGDPYTYWTPPPL